MAHTPGLPPGFPAPSFPATPPLSYTPRFERPPTGETRVTQVVQVSVKGLALDERSKSPVVILQEVGGKRAVPIWIGHAEAQAIAMEVSGKKFQRPLTHDLMAIMLDGLKARVAKVVIADLRENTYYAQIFIERTKELLAIDARPSDAIALALRAKAPIFINDDLLNGEGGDDEIDEDDAEEDDDSEAGATPRKARKPAEPSKEELAEELRRRLGEMNPEDFGKFQL